MGIKKKEPLNNLFYYKIDVTFSIATKISVFLCSSGYLDIACLLFTFSEK